MIPDTALIAYIKTYPGRQFCVLCHTFGLAPYDGERYSTAAKELRSQLQRLRKAGRLETRGKHWYRKEG